MSVLTIRMPAAKHERLRRMAESRGISLNRLVDEWTTVALAQYDAETRFRLIAAEGDAATGLKLLDKLDASYAPKRPRHHTVSPSKPKR